MQWEHGDRIGTRLLHVVLVGALISGPAAAAWVGVTSPSRVGTVSAGSGTIPTRSGDAEVAAAAAQRLVLTWLTASASDRAAVQALVAEQVPPTMVLPDTRPAAPTLMWVGEVDERAPGRFQVTVATTGGALGAAYFTVPVRVDGVASVALALPARTRSPLGLDAGLDGVPALTAVAADDPAFQTAAGYVTAYLTGSAELDRWTAPETGLTAVVPRACNSVRVDGVQAVTTDDASPTRSAVIATATCLLSGRPSTTSQYGLVLQVRDGRWEVAAEDPALLLTSTASTESASSSPPSPPSSPSTPR